MKSKKELTNLASISFCISISILFYSNSLAQSGNLKVFQPLIGKTWVAEGNWGNGTKFKQETTFSYDLDSTIIIANSNGFINKEQTKFGDRNHGIRKWDEESEAIRFWEFDVFGGVTTGKILVDGKNMRYEYQYGTTVISDFWEYIDATTYNFTIGNYEEGKWQQKYLETQFKALNKP
ncbi:hypothetical protein [Croceitalea rosinachiae]|uniref:Uncharacterized protein n=1 Tax=Croceitalea rosinachiae TaxID=3075596 RepID=A0ABU3AAW3_9FLAO|nr:hypothetical protein [Croceitalea sp. F388]MDT0607327.1 hypothetical protein [Croceitalea sp. F388]